MKRKQLNSWYDPAADGVIADWNERCPNRAAFIRDAVREKIARVAAAETREQETLDAILAAVDETRETMRRIWECLERGRE